MPSGSINLNVKLNLYEYWKKIQENISITLGEQKAGIKKGILETIKKIIKSHTHLKNISE